MTNLLWHRVFALLNDGIWHTNIEIMDKLTIYQETVLSELIAEIVDHGYEIEIKVRGKVFSYLLNVDPQAA
ncbi:MAG: hypothetical protein HRU25_07985 [Psychrobium sp.]|nr:hypothetical protein [Psychrobium sp.]